MEAGSFPFHVIYFRISSGTCLEQSRESFKAPLPLRDKVEATILMICARINTHIIDNANIKGRVVFSHLVLDAF